MRESLSGAVEWLESEGLDLGSVGEGFNQVIAAADQWLAAPTADGSREEVRGAFIARITRPQEPLTDEQIVSRAMEAGDLAELCILRDFYPELGAVPEHWVPREHVRRLVRTIERAHGIGRPAQEGGAA